MTEQASTELALPTVTPEQYPALYVSGGLDPFYQQIRQQVLSEVPDLTTPKGIARIKSLASQVASSKVAIEKPGRDYLRQLKEMPKAIEAELRDWKEKMDALRDEVRRPVTDLEAKEKARISELDARLNQVQTIKTAVELTPQTSAALNNYIDHVNAIVIDESWQEYQQRATLLKEVTLTELHKALDRAVVFEQQQAEIARLKAEQDERDRLQREERIAEVARHNAEQLALREKIEAEQREQAAKDAQAKAEQDAKDAQQQLEQSRIDAEARQKLAVEQAAEQDRQRIAAELAQQEQEQEQARIKAEADAKAADIEHQRTYNREALADIIAACPELTESQATTLLTGIIRHKIRHISINY